MHIKNTIKDQLKYLLTIKIQLFTVRQITLQYISNRFTSSTAAPGSSLLFLYFDTKTTTTTTTALQPFFP